MTFKQELTSILACSFFFTFFFNNDFLYLWSCFLFDRPISAAEKTGKSVSVLELPTSKEVVVHERPQDKHSKKFTFDKVFGPSSKQVLDMAFLNENCYFDVCLKGEVLSYSKEMILHLKFIDRCV